MFNPLGRIKEKTWNLWIGFLQKRLRDCVYAIRHYHGPTRTNLLTLDPKRVPKKVTGFHDLVYLFTSSYANRGVIAQDFDEAAYIWKVIVENRPKEILEIGRWLGGSTILISSAASLVGSHVISVDLKIKAPEYALDALIEKHMQQLGLDNYSLYVGSSFEFDPKTPIGLAFIDGDHSYEGVKKDFMNVCKYISREGHILFHDAAYGRRFATYHEDVGRFIDELKSSPGWRFVDEVGSIAHFQKKEDAG